MWTLFEELQWVTIKKVDEVVAVESHQFEAAVPSYHVATI